MLISKKDLLNETGISYGQLYRWKREGLIPEEWFIKQPSFTGQAREQAPQWEQSFTGTVSYFSGTRSVRISPMKVYEPYFSFIT